MATKKGAKMSAMDKKIASSSADKQKAFARLIAQANSDANRIGPKRKSNKK